MRDLLRLLFETELRLLRSRLPRWFKRRPTQRFVSPAALERKQIAQQQKEERKQRVASRLQAAAPRSKAVHSRSRARNLVGFGVSLVVHGSLLIFLLPVLFPDKPKEETPPPEYSISFLTQKKPKAKKPAQKPSEKETKKEPVRPTVEKKPQEKKSEVIADDRPKVEAKKESKSEPNPKETDPLIGLSGGGGPASSALGSRSGDHKEAMREFGGSAATERAVEAGLDWLARHQDADGSWSVDEFHRHCRGTRCRGQGLREYRTGVTALALLAFLGAGIDPNTPHPHRKVVERGLRFLLAQQDRDGCLSPRSGNYMYNHGIAALCLAEAALITEDLEVSKGLLRALRFIESAQQPGGGWDYTTARTLRNDLSVSGWQIMAIYLAKKSGIEVEASTAREAERFIRRAVPRSGIGVYANRPPEQGRAGIAMVAVGLLSKLYLGWTPGSSEVETAANRLIRQRPNPGTRRDWRRSFQGTYYWYYGTLALFHIGGEHWEAWNTFLKRDVLPLQKQSGDELGSWDPDPNWVGAAGGRVASTALSVLIFEVYYRYNPLYREYGKRSWRKGRTSER